MDEEREIVRDRRGGDVGLSGERGIRKCKGGG